VWAQFRAHLKPIREAFGDWRAVEITAAAVDRYITRRLEPTAVAGVVKRGKGKRDGESRDTAPRAGPAARGRPEQAGHAARHPPPSGRQGFFERPGFEAVVAGLPEYLQDLARFGHLTGWRKGEMASLTWADVDREPA
jgi:integrase